MPSRRRFLIPSGLAKIYVELLYPLKTPAPAVVITHGLRSFFPGFLNMFAKRLCDHGYIAAKFHFVGTGKSTGRFEDKTTTAMLKNYLDVLGFLRTRPEVTSLGVVGRSNAGSLATIAGPQRDVRAYVFLAPPLYYSQTFKHYLESGTIRGRYLHHQSFKRPHTKGPGRLPLRFFEEIRRYDRKLLLNAKLMKPVILFQSTADEAVLVADGHFDYWKAHLAKPRRLVLIRGGNHSYRGYKAYVIRESIKWFQRYLPVRRQGIRDRS